MMRAFSLSAQNYPDIPMDVRFVNDLAGVIGFDEADALDIKLSTCYDSTHFMIMILTVNDIDNTDPYKYAGGLIDNWGIGYAGNEKVIVIVFKPRNIKGGIELAVKPNKAAAEMISEQALRNIAGSTIMPYMKKKRYYDGFYKGTDAIMALIPGKGKSGAGFPHGQKPLTLILAALVLFLLVRMLIVSGKKKNAT